MHGNSFPLTAPIDARVIIPIASIIISIHDINSELFFCFVVLPTAHILYIMSSTVLHQYQIVGRKQPSEKEANPALYRMAVFAPNKVVAKSRFWYFLSQLRKMKRASGEVVSCREVFERKPILARNYGIWLRYNSRTNTHNMYKEFRDVSVTGAVEQAYKDMAARHSARAGSIQIIRVAEVAAKDCRRKYVQRFHDAAIKFPLPNRRILKPKRFRATFQAHRPSTVTA